MTDLSAKTAGTEEAAHLSLQLGRKSEVVR
jgi:hypothetical protein